MTAAGSDTRGNALWGRGGRPGGRIGLAVAVVAASLAAAAATAHPALATPGGPPLERKAPTALADAAVAQPNATFRVIVQGGPGLDAQVDQAIASSPDGRGSHVRERFQSVSAVDAELTGAQLSALATDGTVTAITLDQPVVEAAGPGAGPGGPGSGAPGRGDPGPGPGGRGAGPSPEGQVWRAAVGVAGYRPARGSTQPAIAIVDSGIDPQVTGVDPIAEVSLYSGTSPQSPGDGNGHGSFVAGLAAGTRPRSAGAAPGAPVVSIDVMSDTGEAWTSDLIRACDWILANKGAYDIRVANFSLQSSVHSSFLYDPLDAAVEHLWLSGVTVVAAAGNYAQPGSPSGVPYAPANDPFVITVGAADDHGTAPPRDDTAAPWSAWGYTLDGFAKPELAAPGRYIVGTVGDGTTLMHDRGSNRVGPNELMLSGTSFAAPIVSGIADDLLADHPGWTPDQVKGALIASAQPTAQGDLQLGVGEVNLPAADRLDSPPNANAALDVFVHGDGADPYPVFDTAAWSSTASSDAAWASAAWSSAAWASAAWSSAAWASAAWSSAAWSSAAWSSAAWASAAWSSAAWSSAAWSSAAWSSAAWSDGAAADGLGAG